VSADREDLLAPIAAGLRPHFRSRLPVDALAELAVVAEHIPEAVRTELERGVPTAIQTIRSTDGRVLRTWSGRCLRLGDGAVAVLILDPPTVYVGWPRRRMALMVGQQPDVMAEVAIKDILRAAIWPHTIALHAASVSSRDGARLFVGPAGTGKTTLALRSCLLGRARYMAADRTVVRVGRGSAAAIGWPTRIRVAPDSLTLPGLSGSRFAERIAACAALTRKGKHTLTPMQAEDWGIPLEREAASVRAMFFPTLGTTTSPGLQRLSGGAAASRLRAATHRWPEPTWPHWTAWYTGDRVNRASDSQIDHLAASIPCYAVQLSVDVDRSVAACLDATG
jgi:hypothetical protein